MTAPQQPADRPASLEAKIGGLERRLLGRRRAIGSGLEDLAETTRNRLVSAPVLFAAGLFGFMLQKEQSLRQGTLLTMLQAAIGSVRLVGAVSSMLRAFANPSTPEERSQTPAAADAPPD